MTCQACQTWNTDEEHRCRRCGRRLRATPARWSREAYPIAATATALAYETQPEQAPVAQTEPLSPPVPATSQDPQQALFTTPVNQPRVIPFDALTSPAQRESIRERAASLSQPAPIRTGKVEVSPRKARRSRSEEQQQLNFLPSADVIATPESTIQCAAPVAPAGVRIQAALLDGLMILMGTVLFLAVVRFAIGNLPLDKVALSAYALGLCCIAAAYKLIWAYANTDSLGIRTARLRIVDMDGNAPSVKRRIWRAAGSFLSLGAVGVGLLWIFADLDGLAWHDQISGTFPTFSD